MRPSPPRSARSGSSRRRGCRCKHLGCHQDHPGQPGRHPKSDDQLRRNRRESDFPMQSDASDSVVLGHLEMHFGNARCRSEGREVPEEVDERKEGGAQSERVSKPETTRDPDDHCEQKAGTDAEQGCRQIAREPPGCQFRQKGREYSSRTRENGRFEPPRKLQRLPDSKKSE